MNGLLALFLILMAFLGTPLFIVIVSAALALFYLAGVDLSVVVIEMYRLAASPMLIALFLFAFAGYILAESQASIRLVRLSTVIFGSVPGGLAIVALLSCSFFTALTGASGVTIVALGGLLYPALLADRYPEKFSLGLLTTCGSMGLLFPPSLPLIVYGLVAEVNISHLFLAGIIPGTLMVLLLAGYSVVKGGTSPGASGGRASRDRVQLLAAVRESLWEILLPLVVLGGVFGGILAVSEAAAVTAAYVMMVEVFFKREVRFRDLAEAAVQTATMIGSITVILGASLAFNSYLIDQQVPNHVLSFMQSHVESKFTFFLILNLFLLGVGCVLDIFSALVIVVPLIIPIAQNYGIDPVHLGIVFLTNLQIGYSTPPIGMNLFIGSLRFEKPVIQLYLASLPFLVILLLALALIVCVPGLSLFLIR
ncbi:MAG: TRAP transporter large permease subunit [Deltaproteobacteria bacterium]|nr:TRAP transporter large permease subunit [Deltaproteobacteria bacterium]